MARKYSESELLQFILLYLEGDSHQTLVNNYNLKLSERPFRGYVKKFELHGMEGLKYRRSNRRYTKEFKEKLYQSTLRMVMVCITWLINIISHLIVL